MDSNGRKRRGFMKGKLTPFYRAAKSSSTSTTTTTTTTNSMQYTSSKIMKPVVHQDYVINAQPKPKVSFILPAADNGADSLKQFENLYAGIVVDETVDYKAGRYISSVQERFKLERVNSERMKCTQEMIR